MVLFEGTDKVRRHEGYLLVQQYEVFTSEPGESITEIYCRFICLLNDLKQHDKVFDDADVVVKFLDSLPPEWDTESTVYKQVENLKNMSLQTVYGNLLAQEIWDEMKKQTKNNIVVKDEEYDKAKKDAGKKRFTEVFNFHLSVEVLDKLMVLLDSEGSIWFAGFGGILNWFPFHSSVWFIGNFGIDILQTLDVEIPWG